MLRRKELSRTALLTTMSFFILQLVACFSERSEGATEPPDDCEIPQGAEGPGKAVVAISGYQFTPATLQVAPGTEVTWVNCDKAAGNDAHTSTSDAGVWSSPLFALGGTYKRTFTQSGAFPYHCAPHPAMKAVINVQ